MMSWRARLGVLASRGETSGPRVAEAREAMEFWKFAGQLEKAVGEGLINQGLADDAAELAAQAAADKMAALFDGGAAAPEPAEVVSS